MSGSDGDAAEKSWNWITFSAVAACFGPYLVGGFRSEQIVFYVLGFGTFAMVWVKRRYVSRRSPVVLMVLWVGMATVAAVATVSGVSFRVRGQYAFSLQELDNWVMPLASLTLAWSLAQLYRSRDLVTTFAYSLILFVAANACLQIAQLLQGPGGPIKGFLGHFWSSTAAGVPDSRGFLSVGQRVYLSERLTGIINQPAEAGILYALGLVITVWAYRSGMIKLWTFVVMSSLTVIGGLLTLSKAFILMGIPFALVLLLVGAKLRQQLGVLAGTTLMVGLAWSAFVRGEWSRAEGLLDWLIGLTSIGGATGGRISVNGGFYDAVTVEVLSRSPIIGFGLDPHSHTDGESARVIASSGLLGLILLLAFYGAMIQRALAARFELETQTWILSIAVVGIIIGGGVGVPTFSANRVGSLLLLILGLLLFTGPQRLAQRAGRALLRRRKVPEM